MPHPPDNTATIARARSEIVTQPDVSFAITVVEGPNAGEQFAVDATQPSAVLAGQGPACAIRLADREVSRRHAAFEVQGRRLRITDLGSTNGTFVDGLAIADAWLVGEELVRVGTTALRVEVRSGVQGLRVPEAGSFGRVVGESLTMRRIYPLCERLAQAEIPVIVEGETGTGKEALAESIHEQGRRAQGPFVVFDCTAVPPSLLEAELFGHEKGAFTGAVSQRKGVFEQAHSGTLLIDEIGDLDLVLQPKLLRAIEKSEVRRIGADRPIRVDVRLIAATRRDLDREVAAGRFRDDLFHRLAVGRIELPPLRKRQGDVAVLARHFCVQLGGTRNQIPDEVLVRWQEHSWPGNVRELRNAVARYLALGEAGRDHATQLIDAAEPVPPPAPEQGSLTAQDPIAQVLEQNLPLPVARQRLVEEFERRYIEHVLEAHGGNVAKAAAASGIARRYFQILKARKRP
jgi:two-component system, NtrC family, response regulator HydG